MARLIVVTGARAGVEVAFERTVLVGREQSLDLPLPDATVSRRHASISRQPDGWIVADLRTQNGTALNGRRLGGPAPLRDGDMLSFGTVLVRFREGLAEPAAPPPAAPAAAKSANSVLMRLDVDAAPRLAPAGGDPATRLAELQRRFDALTRVAGALLDRSFDEQAVLELILDRLLELLPQAERAFVVSDTAGEFVTRASRSQRGAPGPTRISRTLLREVVATRQAVVSLDASDDQRFSSAESITELHIGSVICAPILARGDVLGVLQVDAQRGASRFGEADLSLVVALSQQLGLFLANIRLHARLVEQEMLDHDMELARRVQRGLLPREAPTLPGYSFAFEYQPALAVGGDFFSFLPLGGGILAIAAGDVSGKGVSAALYAARLSADLRHHSLVEEEPAAILRRLNFGMIGATDEGMFVTACLACLDPASARLRVASAGHPPPLVRDRGGRVSALGEGGGSPVGVAATTIYAQKTYGLEPGDLVLLYTDGVTEAMDARHQLFGDERLIEVVRRAPPTPRGVVDAVLASLRTFAGDEPQSDDITLVCFGRDTAA